jgi:hypothetical protein
MEDGQDILERLEIISAQCNLADHQIDALKESAEEIKQLRAYIDLLQIANSTLFHRMNRLKKKLEQLKSEV